MSDIGLDQRALAASALAVEAGAIAFDAFRARPLGSVLDFKGPQDYITESDAAVEAFVRRRINEAFPEDAILGEEGGGQLGRDLWVVDPIDGTANFARGIPHFCIAIAFVRDRRAEIGAIYCPPLHELHTARRGAGAFRDGKRLRVSKTPSIRHATVEIGWSSRRPVDPYVELVRTVKNAGANVRRGGSGALGLAYVAEGRTDAYCELHMNAWDAVAGLLMIEEAGGFANDFLAGDGLEHGNVVLGCIPALRDQLFAAMQSS